MRLSLLMFMGLLSVCVRAQVGADVDAEYADFCMVDSVGVGDITRFVRLINIATGDVKDFDPVAGTLYTPTGTLITCEQWDLREGNRDPLEDYYATCQCTYTISQEDHEVIQLRGGVNQDYTVEFQEVVRRQCSSETEGVVVYRSTLTRTDNFTTTDRYEYQIRFVNNGDFTDNVNIFKYAAGSTTGTIAQVDLNPSTVTSTYPGLGLNSADFSFNGSNRAAIAAAYEDVIQNVAGFTQNEVSTSVSGEYVIISMQYMHQPNGAYAMLPGPDDAFYNVTGTAPQNSPGVAQVKYNGGLTTSTSNFSEYCTTINTVESGFYYDYNPYDPRTIQILIGVDPNIITGLSTPQAACDVPPQVCGLVEPTGVQVDGCIEDCVDVLNVAGHQAVNGEEITLTASTYNSVSILVNAGTVGVIIDGQRVDYPENYSTSWSASNGKLLANAIRIDATASGAEATITYVK